jgi:hypothetical protein
MSPRRFLGACAILALLLSAAPTWAGRGQAGRVAVELARAAVRRAGVHPERAQSWLRRIHHAAWLPELRLGAERDLGTREAIDPHDGARYGTYSLDEIRMEGRATWRLDRLVFDPEELRASRETVRLAELRQELALTVVRLYFERRRLLLEEALGSESAPREAALRATRIEELSAALEALCGIPPPEEPREDQPGAR